MTHLFASDSYIDDLLAHVCPGHVAPLHDPVWCEEHLRIRVKAGGLPIRLRYNYVQRALEKIFEHLLARGLPIRLLILKARQTGVSTWVESVIYDWIRRRPYQNALIVANDVDSSKHLYEMFKTYHEFDEGAPDIRYNDQTKGLTFTSPHSSQIHVQTAGKRFAGTSLTVQAVHMSELPKWPDPETTYLSIMQAVPDQANSLAIMEGTAAGSGDWWHLQWQQAMEGEGEWLACFFPWFSDPNCSMDPERVGMDGIGTHERYNLVPGEEQRLLDLSEAHIGIDRRVPVRISLDQLAWRRWAINNKCGGDVLLFHQEAPASPEEAFISSGTPKYNVGILSEMQQACTKPLVEGTFPLLEGLAQGVPRLIEGEAADIAIWKWPVPGRRYGIGADCKGSSPFGDYHAAVVGDRGSKEVVATLHGMWDADTYASLLAQAGAFYNGALLAIEVTGVGEAVQNRARRIYHNFYHRLQIDKETRFPGSRIGWYTSTATRPEIVEIVGEHIRDRAVHIHDERIIGELLSFHAVPGYRGADAKPGAHDDFVFALGIWLATSGYTALGEVRGYDRQRNEIAAGEHKGRFR